jgi:hypothetical protein
VFTIFEQCMRNLGNGWLYLATGTIPVWYDFRCTLYLWNRFSCIILIYFFARFTSVEIDGTVYRLLSLWRGLAMLTPTNLPSFFLYVQNEMLCTKYKFVSSLWNSFPIVLSGWVLCPRHWLGHYTSPDNTIGEQFPQEKTIVEY